MTATALEPFRFALFERLNAGPDSGVIHGVTKRVPGLHREGDMSFVTGGDKAAVFATRDRWCQAIGVEAGRAACARQVHGASVTQVTATEQGRGARAIVDALPATDALITDVPGVPLLMCFADCASLLFVDPVRRAVGLAHAGWRGTVADIAGATVRAMSERFGSRPAELLAGIGPAIGTCCYVVGHDVVAAWQTLGIADDQIVQPLPGQEARWRFDLTRANRRLLERAGLAAERIAEADRCTACHVADFFSHRAERGRAGRFAALIALA